MYFTLVLLPFAGSIIVALRGRSIGFTGASIITCMCIGVSSLLAWIAVYEVILNRSPVSINLFTWVSVETITLYWGLSFDDLSVIICAVVLTVSFIVHVFSVDYMAGDPHATRFMSLLSLFTASIVLLVTGDSLGLLFVGWELIGVSSFLLIGFWSSRVQAVKSALKAITINRVGDLFLTVGLIMTLTVFGSLDYAVVFAGAHIINETTLVIITLIMLIGGIAKSAQVPLHSWLAAAIEGPTPVSALIHAATLVTAGVYLILRVSPLLEYASTTLIVIAIVGATTAIFAATSGIVQHDIKRVIAYSTASQIGYLFMSLGLGQYNLALYHLANHATFKALLFMAAGAVIHAIADQQDMRRYGGLMTALPFVYSSLLIGSLSLMAIPYMTGWYSKDGILELAIGSYSVSGYVVYGIGTVVAGLTAYYSVRLIILTFYIPAGSSYSTYQHVHESSVYVVVPLVTLSLFAISLGYVSSDLYRGIGTDFLGAISPTSSVLVQSVDAEFGVPTVYKLIPFIATLLGSVVSYLIYTEGHAYIAGIMHSTIILPVYRFLAYQWNWDALIIRIVIEPIIRLGHSVSKVMDRGILETVGPYGMQQTLIIAGNQIGYYSTERLTDYAIYIVLAILTFVVIGATVYTGILSGILSLDNGIAPNTIVMLLAVNTISLIIASNTDESV